MPTSRSSTSAATSQRATDPTDPAPGSSTLPHGRAPRGRLRHDPDRDVIDALVGGVSQLRAWEDANARDYLELGEELKLRRILTELEDLLDRLTAVFLGSSGRHATTPVARNGAESGADPDRLT
jgi:hypothetical protein